VTNRTFENPVAKRTRRRRRTVVQNVCIVGGIALFYLVPYFSHPPEEMLFEGYSNISFEELRGVRPQPKGLSALLGQQTDAFRVPEAVLALSGKRVTIMGYMLPIETDESEQVHSFALMRDQASCCFGGQPKADEWIQVTMRPGKETTGEMYDLVAVGGPLKVLSESVQGRNDAVYAMDGEKLQKA